VSFQQNKSKLESDIFEHFQELRFQIDEHREMLKEKIDEIASKMIDDSKKNEAMYLRNIKEDLFQTQSFESLENELNGIEDTFRNPNLLIETIKEMQQKQEESLNEIQSKLTEMNRVKVIIMVTNEFKPNTSFSFTSLFGLLKLNRTCSYVNSLQGQILNDEQQCLELIKLCEFSSKDKWSLLYRGTRDGFGNNDFHLRCDGHSNTLTIFKSKGSSYIFGGFTTVSWDGSSRSEWKLDPNAFLFSLTNKDNKPVKMKINPDTHHCAILCWASCGPTFGADINIANNANAYKGCYSHLGFTYKHPQYADETDEARTFLAGSTHFQLDEIEVYQRE
jgi:hypothetical protein